MGGGATSGGVISGVGDVFMMKVHNDEMGDYEIANHIVDYEPNTRIGSRSSRPPLARRPRRHRRSGQTPVDL